MARIRPAPRRGALAALVAAAALAGVAAHPAQSALADVAGHRSPASSALADVAGHRSPASSALADVAGHRSPASSALAGSVERRAPASSALAGSVGRRSPASSALAGSVGRRAPAAAAEDPRARRSVLLLEAAELTDRLEESQADVVNAQMRRSRTADELAVLRARMRERAITAYMRGTGASVAALTAPRAYLEVVATKEKELVSGYRSALAGVAEEQRQAEAARSGLRAAQGRLTAVRAELDATIAVDDTRRAEEQRQADQARTAALAKLAADQAAARARAQAGAWIVTASPGGYAPSPLDPSALLPRHKAATDRQLALMRRLPFGPMTLGAPMPAGLTLTGRRFDGGASWYGPGFNGRPTASGAVYDQEGWTVASRELPLGTLVAVTFGTRRVLLLVNDRGPYIDGRVLDLSAAAARALGIGGVATVAAEIVTAPGA